MNYALTFARGDFVTVYDAEDAPDPAQLRAALEILLPSQRHGLGRDCCIQVASAQHALPLHGRQYITVTRHNATRSAREQGLPIVRVPGARKRYPIGVMVSVDTEAGAVDANYSKPEECDR